MSENEKVVHVVDDDESVRRSVSFMLKTSGYCVHSYADGAKLLNAAKWLEPGCILLDIRMPGMDGLGLQEALRGQGIALPIVIMTGHGDVALSVKAMKAGAIDFIEKPFEKDVLISAIESGFVALSQADRGRDRAKDAAVRLEVLTLREREVLDALAQGCSNKAIAYDLGISPRTVEIHRAHLMTKLGVRSLSEALRLAFAVEEASGALNGG
jgi:two-component system response regulator FixJ